MKIFIQFVNHASVLIGNEKNSILSDPWYSGTAFNDGWSLLYENKRETLAFNESGNKQGYEDRLDDTDFFTVYDFLGCYNVIGFTDEQVEEIIQRIY